MAIGLVGSSSLSSSNSPLARAIGATGNQIAVYLVSAGGLLATTSILLSSLVGVSRVAYAMARRKDLPDALSRLHSRYDTPYYVGIDRSIDATTAREEANAVQSVKS